MKKFNMIGKYPIMALITIGTIVFLIGPVILSLVVAGIIVLPMYLAVRIFGDTE
jgi:E3 ubiquitin-protein ligase DOA10